MNYKVDTSFLVLFLLMILVSCTESSDPNFDFLSPDNVFEGNDPEPIPNLIIESDRIICEFCDGFGMVVEAYENQIFVGGMRKIWVFERNGQLTTLIQEIDFTDPLLLKSVTITNDVLLIGLTDENGTGVVHQYINNTTSWQFELQYEIGRRQDNFGNDIDISDSFVVIGASAPYSNTINTGNADAGSFYIYSKDGSNWSQINEFYAQNSSANDRFGSDVIIWNDFIFVGGLSIPLHVYRLENNEWSLFNVEEDIITADIAHSENIIIYYSEEFGLLSFRLNGDGSKDLLNVNANLDLSSSLRFNGDNISMINGFALVATLSGQELYLLKLVGDEWILEKTFSPAGEPQFEYMGVKLTQETAYIGGNDRTNTISYVFFENY